MQITSPVPLPAQPPAVGATVPAVDRIEALLPGGRVGPELRQTGDRVVATVLGRLAGQRYLADLGGERWVLRVPAQLAVGERLALRVVATAPQLTFAQESRVGLNATPQVPTHAGLAQAAAELADALADLPGNAPATPRAGLAPALPAPPAGAERNAAAAARQNPVFAAASGAERYRAVADLPAAPVVDLRSASVIPELTATARAFGTAPPAGTALAERAAVLRGTDAPLFTGSPREAPHETARVATALREQIANSGLFYEARLARWSAGELPTAELLRSPQALQAAAVARATEALPTAGTLAAATAAPAGTDARPTPQIVNAQLALLLGSELQWEGVAWRDQRYTLAVGEDGGADTGEDADRGWRTALRLELPSLGAVELTVVLRGDRVAISGHAGDPARTARLGAAAGELAQRLVGGGLQLGGIHFGDGR